MKKCFILSAFLTLCLVITLIGGMWSFNYSDSQALNKANKAFDDGNFEEALLGYGQLIENKKVIKEATYNTALTTYKKGDYKNTLTLLEELNSDDYMLQGNCYYKMADVAEGNMEEQIKYLEAAIELYKSGIIQNANDLNIKINYELALRKLEELRQQQEENQQQDNKDQQSNQDKEDGNQNKQDQGDNSQEEDSQQNDSGETEKDNSNSSQENGESANADENQGEQKEEPGTPNEEIINQVLKMLEEQEAESLKNNQALKPAREEETNDW